MLLLVTNKGTSCRYQRRSTQNSHPGLKVLAPVHSMTMQHGLVKGMFAVLPQGMLTKLTGPVVEIPGLPTGGLPAGGTYLFVGGLLPQNPPRGGK